MESMSRKIVRQGKHGRRPVFKCKVCSAMLIVRSGLFGGISVRQLDDETGVQWDLAYQEHLRSRPAAPPGPLRERTQKPTTAQREEALAAGKVECPHCGRFLRDDQGLPSAHRRRARRPGVLRVRLREGGGLITAGTARTPSSNRRRRGTA